MRIVVLGAGVVGAEGLAFSADGRYLYVGNYVDNDISILRVDGTTVTNTGKTLKLPGATSSSPPRRQPAARWPAR